MITLTKTTGALLHINPKEIEAVADLAAMPSQDTGTNIFARSGQVYAVTETADIVLQKMANEK
jgi:uncharacterized protein YlzI (FlbEa/FlbD family)